MDSLKFDSHIDSARALDAEDPLKAFQNEFHFPLTKTGKRPTYFTGHSLGLCPKKAESYVLEEVRAWQTLGVEGHFKSPNDWYSYAEPLSAPLSRLVGADPSEVNAMNSLTTNLHLMMVSFYRPTKERNQLFIERSAFPSDQYAVETQVRFHGYDPEKSLKEFSSRPGETFIRTEDILQTIEKTGEQIALILLGQVHFLTGQAFEIEKIVQAAHSKGCVVGVDLAHGIGNLALELNQWNVDFAVWCSYKYLNGGPGCVGGSFVHRKHAEKSLPRFGGWWGQDKNRRFKMEKGFAPMPGVQGWQLSNPPILPLACLRASLEIFDAATVQALLQKQKKLTSYMEFLLKDLPSSFCEVLTPSGQRGCQTSLRIKKEPEKLLKFLKSKDIICDLRYPDIFRAAPVPLYNRFEEVFVLIQALKEYATQNT